MQFFLSTNLREGNTAVSLQHDSILDRLRCREAVIVSISLPLTQNRLPFLIQTVECIEKIFAGGGPVPACILS
jgi:hypothetical protein